MGTYCLYHMKRSGRNLKQKTGIAGREFNCAKTQKGHPSGWPLHLFDAWQFPTLAWGDPTLPSALRRFTS
ncbi:hypothetical protein ACFX4U_20565, partial [Kosakonia sp. YIM B13588]|uniref:hypothetical protein n=1 Tax=Kosakonia sp. YIM B13588 TaxID=3366289 RepID=UPI0036A210AE